MTGPFLRSRVHLLEDDGQALAFSPETMHLWAVSERVARVLGVADGRSVADAADALSGCIGSADLAALLPKLERAGMLVARQSSLADDPGPDRAAPADAPCAEALSPGTGSPRVGVEGIHRLTLYLTQSCNLRCRYCLTAAGGQLGVGRMSPRVARAALDLLLARCGPHRTLTVAFYGGEPLLELELLEGVVSRAESMAARGGMSMRFSVTTNGTLLDDRACRLLAEHRFSVAVSLDPDPARHDRDRPSADGSGSFVAIVAGVRRLAARGVPATAKVVLVPDVEPMADLVDRLLEMGFEAVSLEPALALDGRGHAEGLNLEGFGVRYGELLRQLSGRDDARRRMPVRAARALQAVVDREPLTFGCEAGQGRIAVAAGGTILPCESFIGVDEVSMGNVLERFDAAVGDRLQQRARVPADGCRTCWARPLCSGPCAQFSLRRFGDPSRPVPELCRLRRAEAEATLVCWHRLRSAPSPRQDQPGGGA